ncbi:MAG TPA: phage shock protein operon transcriptional activator [Candidatus Binatia bacterium]|nr:phage shock protein operon transcriptional activator [Candidatus Binatia bacterium]
MRTLLFPGVPAPWQYSPEISKINRNMEISPKPRGPRLGAESRAVVTQVGRAEALGQCEIFLEFQERLSRVARVNRPVLLIGERGTGKELAVSRLHYLSQRWQGPLAALNCAALSPTLIEAELFGHEEGAFTGATRRRAGRFEAAHGGTLFLDEIGQIPREVQEKILRVVEYGTFERVGSAQPIQVDVRIVGATNADLVALAAAGQFKRDLLDRLSFEVLFVPPLRERREDILFLANHFAVRMAFELGRTEVPSFSDEAITALERYPWPGNVRELKNVVERAVYRAESTLITDIVLDPFHSAFANPLSTTEPQPRMQRPGAETPVAVGRADKSFTEAVQELEIRLLRQALQEARYNQRKAAQILGLTYHQFRALYRKYRNVSEPRS